MYVRFLLYHMQLFEVNFIYLSSFKGRIYSMIYCSLETFTLCLYVCWTHYLTYVGTK